MLAPFEQFLDELGPPGEDQAPIKTGADWHALKSSLNRVLEARLGLALFCSPENSSFGGTQF